MTNASTGMALPWQQASSCHSTALAARSAPLSRAAKATTLDKKQDTKRRQTQNGGIARKTLLINNRKITSGTRRTMARRGPQPRSRGSSGAIPRLSRRRRYVLLGLARLWLRPRRRRRPVLRVAVGRRREGPRGTQERPRPIIRALACLFPRPWDAGIFTAPG